MNREERRNSRVRVQREQSLFEMESSRTHSTDIHNTSLPAILTRSRKRKSSVLRSKYLDDSEIEEDNDKPTTMSPTKERRSRRVSLRRSRPLVSEEEKVFVQSRSSKDFKHPDGKQRRRSVGSYKSCDEESVLSSLSIDDSLSGRSTPPPNSKINRSVKEESMISPRLSPLPPVSFANCSEVWDLMCKMDLKYKRSTDVFKNHPLLSSQMRTILLDWLMDVCEAYTLHRETLYLTIDFLDRYLALQSNVLRQHLQLIGITCLFIASKVEEIYPPKLQTFAYVTDGACTEAEILDMELVVMKTLKWKLSPITPATWINVYLQVLSINPHSTRSYDFLRSVKLHRNLKPEDSRLCRPQYAGVEYVRCVRIVDLAVLDVHSLNYTYSMLAAAAVFHTKGRAASLASSGYTWEVLAPCVLWMSPFAAVVKRAEVPDVLPGIKNVSDEARHLIQSHCIHLSMLEQVSILENSSKICSPMTHIDGLLTPPRSSEKYRKVKPM